MRALGARLIPVPYDVAWKALEERAYPGVDGTFVHPFDDHNFIAGHATMGLEILEDAPDAAAVIAGIGGGGLITGVAQRGQGAEARDQSVGRGAGDGRAGGTLVRHGLAAAVSRMDGVVRRRRRRPERLSADVGAHAAAGRRLHRREPRRDQARDAAAGREGTSHRRRRGSSAVAAALTGKAGQGPIVAIVSGGNIDLKKFSELIASVAD